MEGLGETLNVVCLDSEDRDERRVSNDKDCPRSPRRNNNVVKIDPVPGGCEKELINASTLASPPDSCDFEASESSLKWNFFESQSEYPTKKSESVSKIPGEESLTSLVFTDVSSTRNSQTKSEEDRNEIDNEYKRRGLLAMLGLVMGFGGTILSFLMGKCRRAVDEDDVDEGDAGNTNLGGNAGEESMNESLNQSFNQSMNQSSLQSSQAFVGGYVPIQGQ